ncbi:Endonuclease/exonuclease/phosphatase [Aspergillus avenaceus]|uniref:Endonuclease/exonuclease/phosphatase n=1 Tax=Aspergillus avenaceus TaxID=36643 RepID=A0A5N6THX5_ASPAV|nr:Endonuclease/exonuclease/phosphatase [Aspergillus avenaceus]
MPEPCTIRLITHNIRTIPWFTFPPEKPWNVRRTHVISQLDFNTAYNPEALICLQEALHNQLTDILDGLNSSAANDDDDAAGSEVWKYIGHGRDGAQKGEYSAILYRAAVWEVEWTTTRWLSETPEKPSRGWDAAYRRIATYAVLRHKRTGRRVLAMNTHLDDRGQVSRFESAKLILQWVEEMLERDQALDGCFLCGDFNTPSQKEDDAFGVLTGPGALLHTRDRVEGKRRYGNINSWTGFNDWALDDALLDYVLVGPFRGDYVPWSVRAYGILTNRFDDGIFSSDHRAVVADVDLLGARQQ